jgi:hypothetical protein
MRNLQFYHVLGTCARILPSISTEVTWDEKRNSKQEWHHACEEVGFIQKTVVESH